MADDKKGDKKGDKKSGKAPKAVKTPVADNQAKQPKKEKPSKAALA
jgi:hypothetical protein